MQPPLQPEQLEQAIGAFRLSRLLHLTVRLGLVRVLQEGPMAAGAVAAACTTQAPATAAALEALWSWGVLDRDAIGRYAINAVSRRLLPGVTGGVNLAMVDGWAGLDAVLDAWLDLEHTLRTGDCALHRQHGCDFHGMLAREPAQAERYHRAMASTTESFEACAAVLEVPKDAVVVDVGGGHGDLLATVLRQHPGTRGICVDLPAVVQHRPPALGGRLTFCAADAQAALPPGADLYLTSTVLRCFDDEAAARLLRTVRQAMTRPRARLVCFEMVRLADIVDPWMALANLTAHVVYGGRDRTEPQWRALFRSAGFTEPTFLQVEGRSHAISALCASQACTTLAPAQAGA